MKDSFSFLSYYSLISDNKPRKDMVFSNVYMVSNLVICLLCSCSDPPARHRAVCSWSPLLVSECKDGVSLWRCESLPAERVEQTPDGETHCVVLCFSSNQSAIHILLVVLNVVMKCCPNTCSSLLFWIFCLFWNRVNASLFTHHIVWFQKAVPCDLCKEVLMVVDQVLKDNATEVSEIKIPVLRYHLISKMYCLPFNFGSLTRFFSFCVCRLRFSGTWRRPASSSLIKVWVQSAKRWWTATSPSSLASLKENWWAPLNRLSKS